MQYYIVENFPILQNQSRAVSVTSTRDRSRIQNKSKCFSKLPRLWQLKLLTWWKEITQFHNNNKNRAVQTSVPLLGRNLLKQIQSKTKWWLRGVCWGNNFWKPIFRFLFVEITFNSHILTQIYESFCIILSLLPYDNRKYVSVGGSFVNKNRCQLRYFQKSECPKVTTPTEHLPCRSNSVQCHAPSNTALFIPSLFPSTRHFSNQVIHAEGLSM